MGLPPCQLCGKYTPGRVRQTGDCSHCHLWFNHPGSAVVLAWKGVLTLSPVTSRPAPGVGTVLKMLLLTVGVTDSIGCGCNAAVAEMNALGVTGVRQQAERFGAVLRENAKRLGWMEFMGVFVRAVASGIIVSPLDPYTGLVLEACKRAESKTPFT